MTSFFRPKEQTFSIKEIQKVQETLQGLGFLLAVFVAVGTRSEPMGEGQLRLEPRETFLGEKVLVLETQP